MLRFSRTFICMNQSTLMPKQQKLKPVPLKKQMQTVLLAKHLQISQQILRNQMLNPKANTISEQQISMLGIINGVKIPTNKLQVKDKKYPVVTIMGHVDHGKTTLIDFLRKSNITQGQAGGITQSIGAFSININNEHVTFIDTPGHEAFNNMRQRGAVVTDLIVLIVSAVEGVKKQTKEVIDILKRDGIKTIVAINKIDIQNSNIQMVEEQLRDAGLSIQPFDGNIPVVHISAKTGFNVDLLCELILQQTKQTKAERQCYAQGVILQACQNNEGSNTCTVIMHKGILKVGSYVIIGMELNKIKYMMDDKGNFLNDAFPGQAVQLVGISDIPNAGDYIFEVDSLQKGKHICQKMKDKLKNSQMSNKSQKIISSPLKIQKLTRRQRRAVGRGHLDKLLQKFDLKRQQLQTKIDQLLLLQSSPLVDEQIEQCQQLLRQQQLYYNEYINKKKNSKNSVNLILKFADRGKQETVIAQFYKMKERIERQSSIQINLMHSDVGDININDLQNASLMNAQILTFGVKIKNQLNSAMKQYNVTPRVHNLIHTLFEDIKNMISAKKKGDIADKQEIGKGQIKEIFNIKSGKSTILTAGVKVTEGNINLKNKCVIIRNQCKISDQLTIKSIKEFKKQVSQIKKGGQCTITFKESFEFQKNDEIIAIE